MDQHSLVLTPSRLINIGLQTIKQMLSLDLYADTHEADDFRNGVIFVLRQTQWKPDGIVAALPLFVGTAPEKEAKYCEFAAEKDVYMRRHHWMISSLGQSKDFSRAVYGGSIRIVFEGVEFIISTSGDTPDWDEFIAAATFGGAMGISASHQCFEPLFQESSSEILKPALFEVLGN